MSARRFRKVCVIARCFRHLGAFFFSLFLLYLYLYVLWRRFGTLSALHSSNLFFRWLHSSILLFLGLKVWDYRFTPMCFGLKALFLLRNHIFPLALLNLYLTNTSFFQTSSQQIADRIVSALNYDTVILAQKFTYKSLLGRVSNVGPKPSCGPVRIQTSQPVP